MIGVQEHSIDETKLEWSTPGFDMANSTRVVLSPENTLVAYTEVWDNHEPPVNPWIWARVHPENEGMGIGSALMDWGETRISEVFSKVPQDAMVSVVAGTYAGYTPAETLFTDRGMTPARHFWQMIIEFDRDLDAPAWPEGIELVSYQHDRDARDLFRAQREAFRDHWGYIEEPFETAFKLWSHRVFNHKWFDPSLWYLAKEADEIVGFARCQSERDEDPDLGWVNSLGVRRRWRKRGIGLALLLHGLHEIRKIGKRRAGLGVDSKNLTGATRLYERAGMHIQRQFDVYEKVVRPGVDLRTTSLLS